jgi:hypothetical protein
VTNAVTRKLIEVALPLDAITKEAAREKSIRHGHPSTLHLWWARRPLAAHFKKAQDATEWAAGLAFGRDNHVRRARLAQEGREDGHHA